jgi:glycosyltransferase involved in cell wall biosynthesis
MTIEPTVKRRTVLHVATINKPIRSDLGYAPIETIIHNIDKGLRSLGCRSIVACSADSRVSGEHCVTVPHSLGEYWCRNTSARQEIVNLHLSRALERTTRGDIDIIHMHEWLDHVYDGLFSPTLPVVMTLHVPARDSAIREAHQRRCRTSPPPSLYFVAISEYQRRQYAGLANVWKTVHHGIEVNDFPCKERPDRGSYLFSIGRVTRVKGQDQAIALARKTGAKLILAGCVQNKPEDREFFDSLKESINLFVDVGKVPVGRDYYDTVIKPLLDCDKQIIYIGELDNEQKKEWYRHARATVFPIQWGEPFGLVLIESMACGTPVLAFNAGAVPEIVADGHTGFVVESPRDLICAVGQIDRIDPRACRQHVQDHFSLTSMAGKYAEVYQEIIEDAEHKSAASGDRGRLLMPVLPGEMAA